MGVLISEHYEKNQESLVKKCSALNSRIINAIKKANVDNSEELLSYMGLFLIDKFTSIQNSTKGYLNYITKKDVKIISTNDNVNVDSKIVTNSKNQTYIELNSNLVCAEKELMKTFKSALSPYKNKSEHISKLKNILQQKFVENGGVTITYRNGAKVRLDKYFQMATRTARNETQNLTSIEDAKKLGTDYVYLAPNTNSSCRTCSAFGNRVYSISGKDKRYPSLYSALFKNGYHCIHPHCRCLLRPFFPEDHSSKENNKLLKESNRDYDLDERSEEIRQNYQNQQAYNHKRWSEELEFEKSKTTLGKEMPSELNTLKKYRMAKTRNTPRYNNTKLKVKETDFKSKLTTIEENGRIQIIGSDIFVKQSTEHLIKRMVERKISNDSVIETLKTKPLKIGDIKYNKFGDPSQEIIYDDITICVNPKTGNLITVHRTHKKIKNKLNGDKY